MVSRWLAAERGQLILAGSIGIAVIIIGLTLVLNSVIFTENIVGGSSVEVSGDVHEFNNEARRNTRSLAMRINHETIYDSQGNLSDDLDGNFTNYSLLLAESYADSGSVYVNLTYEGTQQYGSRLVQEEDNEFTKNPGDADWNPVSGVTDVRWFVVNVRTENVSLTNHFVMRVTDHNGTELRVTMRRNESDDLLVNSSITGSPGLTSNVTCVDVRGRVLIDMLDGTTFSGGCEFNSTEYLEPPYQQIRFENGPEIYGKYEMVGNTSSNWGSPDCSTGVPFDRPCYSPAAWEVQITTRYTSESVTYQNTQNVTVYRRDT